MSDLLLANELRALKRRVAALEAIEAPISWRSGFPVYWDGTRYLTAQEYSADLGLFDAATITYAATTTSTRLALLRTDYTPLFTYGVAIPGIGATNSGVNYWTFNLVTSGGTTIWTFNTSADAAASNPVKTTTAFTQPGAATSFVQLNLAATGAPSGIVPRFPVLYYRLIIP